jgi:hypothetical protein
MRRRAPRAPAPYDAPAALCRGGVVGQGTPSAVRSKAQYASAIPRMSGSASCPTGGLHGLVSQRLTGLVSIIVWRFLRSKSPAGTSLACVCA